VPDKCPSCDGDWGPQSANETSALREIIKSLEALGKGENKYLLSFEVDPPSWLDTTKKVL
jgi:hypothetical protein